MARHPSYDSTCDLCNKVANVAPVTNPVLWEDDLWRVQHSDPPFGVAGWTTIYSKRHFAGPAYFDDGEAAAFGPTLRRLELTLLQVTGALRIYTSSYNETPTHFHCHMVPRYEHTPGNVKGWSLFDLLRRAREGEVTVDVAEVERIIAEFRSRLTA